MTDIYYDETFIESIEEHLNYSKYNIEKFIEKIFSIIYKISCKYKVNSHIECLIINNRPYIIVLINNEHSYCNSVEKLINFSNEKINLFYSNYFENIIKWKEEFYVWR